MKRGTFNYIKQILKDYPKLDQQIKERKEEIQFPYREDDVNADIKGNSYSKDGMVNYLIAIEADSRINLLEKHKRVISENLKECDQDTFTIINELYLRRYPRYRIDGLVQNHLISCGRSKAYELRNQFFDNIAEDLNLWT